MYFKHVIVTSSTPIAQLHQSVKSSREPVTGDYIRIAICVLIYCYYFFNRVNSTFMEPKRYQL